MIWGRIVFILLCAAWGCYAFGQGLGDLRLAAAAGGAVGLLLVLIEWGFSRIRMRRAAASAAGLLYGLVLALLLRLPGSLVRLVEPWGFPLWAVAGLAALVSGWLVYLSMAFFVRRNITLGFVAGAESLRELGAVAAASKILDTSVIIDGRIADMAETGFVEGSLIVPRFVLRELQSIADSSDPMKRRRGRRGLEVLNRLQSDPELNVELVETDFPDIREVDAKLVALAKSTGAKVLTNDYNLNKVAELQGAGVLNINGLAEALKPVVLPGEPIAVRVVKEGKEPGQGVAYLDDGTMVVVDSGKNWMGQTVEVVVTSVLQTTAGRMIFARLSSEETSGV